jgi:hypothetical protein
MKIDITKQLYQALKQLVYSYESQPDAQMFPDDEKAMEHAKSTLSAYESATSKQGKITGECFQKVFTESLTEERLEEMRGVSYQTNIGEAFVDWKQGHAPNYFWSDLNLLQVYPKWYYEPINTTISQKSKHNKNENR